MSWFASDEQRDAHIAALREELALYVSRGMRDRAEQVIEQLHLLGEKDSLPAASAAKPSARRQTRVAAAGDTR